MGASAILKSVDFRPFAVNVKTIALGKHLYQSGYAIWWYTMPQAMFTFLEEYDFSGKTLIPFATHGGYGVGSSVEDIRKLCPDANVIDDIFEGE